MYNLGDDKELDRLSREAAGKYTTPGEANWQALSGELDKVLPVEEKKRRILFFWWLLPLLLIGGGLTYWLIPKEETTAAVTSQSAITVPQVAKKQSHGAIVDASLQKKETTTDVTTNSTVAAPSRSATTLVTNKNGSVINIKKNPENNSAIPGNSSLSLNSSAKAGKAVDQVLTTANPASAIQNKATENIAETPQTQSLAVTAIAEQVVAKETTQQKNTIENTNNNNATAVNEEIKTTEPAPVDNTAAEAKITKAISRPGKGFSFSLLAGADKSTVKFTYSKNAGINLGAMAGYHFSNRWSIHTGAIYTQKNYKMEGEDFTAPKGSIISYYKLETVDGFCRMWEVPLLVRYTLSRSAKNSVFLSTGLSSYFMTRENYSYFYYYNNQPVTRNNNYISTDKHILSIAHFSAGFDKKISQSLSMQIEPYAKLPLGGIGLGDIRLSSFGINFSVQYRQPTKK
ncbi:MAG: outer membrane beta-barrel protein [Bacteroidota bacterium]